MASKTRSLTYTAMGAVLIALGAWISIPAAVPFTLQTFAVFLVLDLLGGRRGTAAILVYILLGLVGLPVFAGFSGGPGVLLGPTGGYILGFLFTGGVYWLAERLPAVRLASCGLGLVLCYAFGSAWFLWTAARGGAVYSLHTVLGLCVAPFVVPDCLKLAAALAVSRRLAGALRLTGLQH